jgi:hypothetical protein
MRFWQPHANQLGPAHNERARRADFDTLRGSSAKVAVIGLAPEEIQSLEGAFARSLPGPDELLSFCFRSGLFSFKTFHLLALAANEGRVHAGAEIVLLDANGRLLRIHSSEMKK